MIALCDTGLINLKSLQRAFEHLGHMAVITARIDEISCCDQVVLCAAGSFKECFDAMRKNRFDRALRAAAAAGKPVLGIGMGMQLLCSDSNEGGLFKGASLLPHSVQYSKACPPADGFYSTKTDPECAPFRGIEQASFFYFQNAFVRDTAGACAVAEHCGDFCAAAVNGSVSATAFYPHKSGEAGIRVLANFLEM